MKWIGLMLSLLAFPLFARALTFRVGCTDPCGQSVIVQQGTAVCTATLQNDSGFTFIAQPSSTATITDADGADVVGFITTPIAVPSGSSANFPVTVTSDPADVPGEIISVDVLLHSNVIGFPQPVDEEFTVELTVLATSTCSVTTTTLATTTTAPVPTTTTTTIPVLGFPRLRVCSHNGQPKKCD